MRDGYTLDDFGVDPNFGAASGAGLPPHQDQLQPDLRVISAADMRRTFFPQTFPSSEQYRTYFGKSLDLGRIESALRNADYGFMALLTDMESEALSFDPHLSGIVNKRFGQLRGLEWDVTPAQGPDTDDELASLAAEKFRAALKGIPDFSEHLYLLAWSMFDGRSCAEVFWDLLGGGSLRWRPRALSWLHPRRLGFGPERDLQVIDTWRARGNFCRDGLRVADFPGKFIWGMPKLFREYQEREGLAPRTLYWSYFKRFDWRFRMALVELFGIPWRIVKAARKSDDIVSRDALEEARTQAENLGGMTTAMLGKGIDLDVFFPGENSGNMFSMTSKEVDEQMSKLVLWQTGTTDGGQTRAEGIVHKGEQDLVLLIDAENVSAMVQHHLAAPFTALNYGADAVPGHAPTFQLRAKPPRDQAKDLERAKTTISLGLPVALAELQELAGVRTPVDEPYVVGSESAGYKVIDPTAADSSSQVLGAGDDVLFGRLKVTDAAADGTTIVNEIRKSRGLGPMVLPGGQPDPRGLLPWAVFQAMAQAGGSIPLSPDAEVASGALTEPGAVKPGEPETTPRDEPLQIPEQPLTDDIDDEKDAAEQEAAALVRAARAVIVPRKLAFDDPLEPVPVYHTPDEVRSLLGFPTDDDDPAAEFAAARLTEALLLGKHTPSDEPIVDLVRRSAREAARATEAMAAEFIKSVPETGTMTKAWRSVSRAAARIDSSRLARIVEQASLRALMFGAWEAAWEAENDAAVAPAAFERGGWPALFEQVYGVPPITQQQSGTCGPAALRAVLRYWGVEATEAELREESGWSEKRGASPEGLAGAARERGFDAEVLVDSTLKGLRKAVAAGHPVIVDWFSGSEGHYSVATRADDERVTVLDVETGEERHFAPDEFARVWFDFDGDTEKHDGLRSGVMIVVTPKPGPVEATRRLMAAAAGEQAAAEVAEGASKEVVKSTLGRSGEVFVRKPFAEAVAEFASRKVLTKRAFERLVGANKKRAFTIANLGKRAMVEVAHSELTGAIREGIDLRAFRANLAERFTTAGWTPMNPSHVELVFRNATMSAHANGRDAQMTQPHVLKARPYWQVLGVDDSETRPTHKAAHTKVLPASDSFWDKGPTYGFNCRCRKVSRSEADLERLGLSVSSGEEAWAQALPDEGWNE